jgi:hypothetical protein
MPFQKGYKGGQLFTPEHQPKKNGRKPALYKQLAAMVGKQVNLTLSKDDFVKIQHWLLERTKAELKDIIRDPQTPIFMSSLIAAIIGDMNSGSYATVERTYDRLFGRAVQPIEATVERTYNLEGLSEDEIMEIGEILTKTTVKNDKSV